MRHRTRNERGGSSVELAVTAPLLLLLILATVQAGLWAHAIHVTHAAADAAVESTRLTDGSAAAGTARARRILQRLGGGLVLAPDVTVSRTPSTARVTIAAGIEHVVPGLHPHTRVTVTAPVERFTPSTGGAP